MSIKNRLDEALAAFLDFGAITDTVIADAAKSVVATIEGDVDEDGSAEKVEECELWGSAALLVRPADPDSSGRTEVVYLRRGDELVGILTKDRRWQVDLEKGEVVVRGLGASAARIRLKPDGTAVLDAAAVKVGDTAGEAIPLGDALKSWLDGHKHSYTDSDSGVSTTLLTGPPSKTPGPPFDADTSPDPSSKHKVES